MQSGWDDDTDVMAASSRAYQFSGTFLAIAALIALALMVVSAVLVYRDVQRHDGDGAQVVFAWIVFLPLGVWLWWRARRTGDEGT